MTPETAVCSFSVRSATICFFDSRTFALGTIFTSCKIQNTDESDNLLENPADFSPIFAEQTDNPLENDDFILKTAQKAFGITYLYPWQRLVIANILEPENENSQQIVLLPTGAGKSMCFLVPALVFEGATLILYPLLALMQDQERRMQEGNLSAVTFRGGQSPEERAEKIKAIKEGKAKVILANPEVLQSKNLIAQQGKRWRAFCPCRRAQSGERRQSLRTVYRQSPCRHCCRGECGFLSALRECCPREPSVRQRALHRDALTRCHGRSL